MKKLFKKISVLALVAGSLCVTLASCGQQAEEAVQTDSIRTQLASTSDGVAIGNSLTANSINNGNIFHAWDWSMSTIEANLDSIKAAGFTTIQTSPMQPQKDYYAGNTSKEAMVEIISTTWIQYCNKE